MAIKISNISLAMAYAVTMAIIPACLGTSIHQGETEDRQGNWRSASSTEQRRRQRLRRTAMTSETKRCFEDRDELKNAVEQYIAVMGVMTHEGQSNGAQYDKEAAEYTGNAKHVGDNLREMYGWPIGSWCTSRITDFSGLFENATTFNDDLSGWDTSNAKTMERMFTMATSFNRPLNSWNVGNVENFDYMFTDAKAFHQSLSNWDTSNAISMKAMFADATSFSGQGLSNWQVTTKCQDMEAMFLRATNFNEDISSWHVSSNTRLTDMFYDATSFDQNLCSWGYEISQDPRGDKGYDGMAADVTSTTHSLYFKMFEGTHCPATESPQFEDANLKLHQQGGVSGRGNRILSSSYGPFCYQCDGVGAAATVATSIQSKKTAVEGEYHKPKVTHEVIEEGYNESTEAAMVGAKVTARAPTSSYICRMISFKMIGLVVFACALIGTIRFLQFRQKHFYSGVNPEEHQLTEFELIKQLDQSWYMQLRL